MKNYIPPLLAIAALGYLSYYFIFRSGDSTVASKGDGEERTAEVAPSVGAEAETENKAGSEFVSGVESEGASESTTSEQDLEKRFSGAVLKPVASDSPHLGGHASWPDARVVSVWEEDLPDKRIRRVSLLQPNGLPYPVRIEEVFEGDGSLARQTTMVANRFVLKIDPDAEVSLKKYASANGITFRRISAIGLYRLELDELTPDGVPIAIRQVLHELSEVDYAEPDYIQRKVESGK